MKMTSLDGIALCKPYKHEGLKAEVKSGFASVSQKTGVVPLEAIVPGKVRDTMFMKGQTIYVLEEDLVTAAWGKAVRRVEGQEESFIIVPEKSIIAVSDLE